MAEQQEHNAIDALFRKTFDDLPETPATTGWDTPSDQVWQQVAHHIEHRQTGWSTVQRLRAVAVIGISVAIAIYFYNNPTVSTAAPDTPVAIQAAPEAPVQPAAAADANTDPSATTAEPVSKPAAPAQPAAINHRQLESQNARTADAAAPATAVATPPPAPARQIENSIPTAKPQDKPVLNSTERAKLKAQKEAALWKTPLQTLLPRETQQRLQDAFRQLQAPKE